MRSLRGDDTKRRIMKVTPKEKITALTAALVLLSQYRQHDGHCEIDRTDFCTCGMKRAMDAARKADALEVEY
jgi:hypothetical protein